MSNSVTEIKLSLDTFSVKTYHYKLVHFSKKFVHYINRDLTTGNLLIDSGLGFAEPCCCNDQIGKTTFSFK